MRRPVADRRLTEVPGRQSIPLAAGDLVLSPRTGLLLTDRWRLLRRRQRAMLADRGPDVDTVY